MRTGVGHLVDLGDVAVGIDEKGHPFGIGRVVLVGTTLDTILTAHGAIDVSQQAVVELVVRGEDLVVFGGVERDADDGGTEFGELWASITEALPFARSTAGRGFGVPPEHDPRAALVGEVDDVAVFVGE